MQKRYSDNSNKFNVTLNTMLFIPIIDDAAKITIEIMNIERMLKKLYFI